ncbi:MAG: MgtC/SapB family protein [Terriglobales bacterium]
MNWSFPIEMAVRLGVALGVGLLVGLEREWAHKEVGVRTFALTAMLGALCWFLSPWFALAGWIGIFLLVIGVNARSLLVSRSLEITTSVALMVTYVLGVFLGQGHLLAPVAAGIVMTALLAWKAELARFAERLLIQEIRGALLLGLLTLVIYPLLPRGFVDPWRLVDPRDVWVAVMVIAGIGFCNYVLLRLYGARGMYYTAGLGGLVNSTATVVELSRELATAGDGLAPMAVAAVLLTVVAMFVRNLGILAIFAAPAVLIAWGPLALMTALAAVFAWRAHRGGHGQVADLKLGSPVALGRVLLFGAMFLGIEVAAALAHRYLGSGGFLVVSVLGGLVSSASTVAAAAVLAAHGRISFVMAGVATVLASVTSALVNLPFVYQQTRQPALTRRLTLLSAGMVAAGLVALGARLVF